MLQDGGCRLSRVTLAMVTGEERVAQIRMVQKIALEQAAAAEWHAIRLADDTPEAKAMPGVAGHRALAEVLLRARNVAHALVANEFEKQWLIEQLEDKCCVAEGELADDQALGGENLLQGGKFLFGSAARWFLLG